MDWKTASTIYAQQLKEALDVRRHALALVDLAPVMQTGVTKEQKDKLRQAGEPAEKQMRRLQNGEFRIAVVGLEKAGKSTFVNAWLGCDLLPAKTERCTFTTTQIYSVQHENEQRLETQPKTEQQYRNYKRELDAQALQDADKNAKQQAENDLKVMKEHDITLQEVLTEGKKTYRFSRLEDIKEDLSRYVADVGYAHAMQEARLYTSNLAAIDGVVFYDVPGLDSGLSKHIEESKEMLADCDAIILVQRRDISLKAHEQDLIKFGQNGDPYLKLADKMFVFWGQIDLHVSRATLDEDWQKLLKIWANEGIPAHRIVRGSAGAHLVLSGFNLTNVGTLAQVTEKMEILTDLTNAEELKGATGIVELKQLIQRYLDEERTALLEIRCSNLLRDILDTAKEVYSAVRQCYPEDPEQAKRAQEEQRIIEFSEWWGKRWEKIRADVSNLFKEGTETSAAALEQFRQRYEELANEEMSILPSRQPIMRQQIFDSISIPTFDSNKANIAWRETLYPEVRQMLIVLSHSLAMELQKQVITLVEDLKNQLWGSKRVQPKLIEDNGIYILGLERSLHTLFLRFARPIAEVLIRGPVGSETRQAARKRIGPDIEIIDNYYQGDEPALKRLGRYATHGVKLLNDENVRKEVLGPAVGIVKVILGKNLFADIAFNAAQKAVGEIAEQLSDPIADKRESLIEEVEADIRVLEYYLKFGIFEAAGFSAFCQQELDSLRDSFIEAEHYWKGVVEIEWQKGNPALLKELPPTLQELKFDTEVSDKLKQLGLALNKVSIKV